VHTPGPDAFERIADLTALRMDPQGRPYVPNPSRGSVLYALVAARRPSVVLEFGTGRGYGALSMAWAMADHGIDGMIWTIDLVPHGQAFDWILRDERGPRVERTSRERLWGERFPRAWLARITPLTGRSREIMRKWDAARGGIELAFVDGGHDLATARHDILAACLLAGPRFGLLADDYIERPGYGVVAAFRELFGDPPPITLLQTAWGEMAAEGAGMAWLTIDDRPDELTRLRTLGARRGGLLRMFEE
jgi:methyltransferase family protein